MAVKRNLNLNRAADQLGLDEDRVIVDRRPFNTMLALLRIGCGIVALLSGILKFVTPGLFALFAASGAIGGALSFPTWNALMPIIGIVEIIVGAMLILGIANRVAAWLFSAWALVVSLVTVGGGMDLTVPPVPLTASLLPSFVAAYHFFLALPAGLLLAFSNAGRIMGMDRATLPKEEAKVKPKVTLYPEEKEKVKY